MAFNAAYQPILTDTGVLAIACVDASVAAASVGLIKSAGFSIETTSKDIKAGFPAKLVEPVIASTAAKATLEMSELGGPCKALLVEIAASLNTGVIPKKDVQLEVFRPAGANLLVDFTGAAMLQEFSLNFANDINSCGLQFEALVPNGSAMTDVVAFSAGSLATIANTNLISKDNISIGFPAIGAHTSISSASVSLTTSYKRVETGFPSVLRDLVPIEHAVTLEFVSDDFTLANLNELLAVGGPQSVVLSCGLYDGTAIVITLPAAQLQAAPTNISQTEWASQTKRFVATGTTLITIA